MVNPADWVKKGVSKLHDWFEKTDREEMEQRLEIAQEPEDPRKATLEPESLEALGESSHGLAPPTPAPAGPRAAGLRPPTPQPPAPSPLGPPQYGSGGNFPPASRGIAGLGKRDTGDDPDSKRIVVNDTNDTVYRQRDILVTAIRERYVGYGERVATVMLQRALQPNGLELIVTKLGLTPTKSLERDHQQVLAFLNNKGVDAFCEALGVKTNTSSGSKSGTGGGTRPASSASDNVAGSPGDNDNRPPKLDSTNPGDDERRRLNAQHSLNKAEKGASHSIKLQKVNVKPIQLGTGTPPPPAKVPAPVPAAAPNGPRVALSRPETPMPVSHTNAPRAGVSMPPASFPGQPPSAPSAKPSSRPQTQDPKATRPSAPRPGFTPWNSPAMPPHLEDTAPSSPAANTPAGPPPAESKSAADFLAAEMDDSDRYNQP